MPQRAQLQPARAPKERVGLPWKVDVSAKLAASGKREKHFFRTKDAADQFCTDERARLAEFSDSARHLTGEQKLEAYKCLLVCQEFGFTLTDAVAAMRVQVERTRKSIGIPALAEALHAHKKAQGKKPHYLRDLKNRLAKFTKAHPQMLASDLTPEGVEEWLSKLTTGKGRDHTAVSKNNYRRVLGVAFSFAVLRGWMPSNPVEKIEQLPEPKEEVAIFSPEQTEALLCMADPSIRPALAIGAFAGIRPEEILRLPWKSVRLDHGDILVDGLHAKTGSRRLVTITPNLRAWLESADRSGERVAPVNFRKLRVAAQMGAHIPAWPRDVLRHSFASHHLALREDAAATALQLGHATTKMLFAHYRGLVRKADAARYFDIVPKP